MTEPRLKAPFSSRPHFPWLLEEFLQLPTRQGLNGRRDNARLPEVSETANDFNGEDDMDGGMRASAGFIRIRQEERK